MPRRRRAVSPPTDSIVRIIPVEIFSEIFLVAIQADPRSQRSLMLVCRRWHDIMLSTPGNRSQLRIGRSTQKKEVEAAIGGNRSLLDVIVDMDIWGIWTTFCCPQIPCVLHGCSPSSIQVALLRAGFASASWRI